MSFWPGPRGARTDVGMPRTLGRGIKVAPRSVEVNLPSPRAAKRESSGEAFTVHAAALQRSTATMPLPPIHLYIMGRIKRRKT